MLGVKFKWFCLVGLLLLSACLLVLLVCLYFSCVTSIELKSGDLASWVQAIGVILSIWAAWWMARAQAKRAEEAEKRNDAAKCLALAEIINNALSVFQAYRNMASNGSGLEGFRRDLSRAKVFLDSVDLFKLPDPELIQCVCSARALVDKTVVDFKDPTAGGHQAIFFEKATALPAIELLSACIQSCKVVLERFK